MPIPAPDAKHGAHDEIDPKTAAGHATSRTPPLRPPTNPTRPNAPVAPMAIAENVRTELSGRKPEDDGEVFSGLKSGEREEATDKEVSLCTFSGHFSPPLPHFLLFLLPTLLSMRFSSFSYTVD